MADKTDYQTLLSSYYATSPRAGNTSKEQSAKGKRKRAVAAALSLLEAQALGGATGNPTYLRTEVGPLADAIQEALDKE